MTLDDISTPPDEEVLPSLTIQMGLYSSTVDLYCIGEDENPALA